jgi:hypothetical protein
MFEEAEEVVQDMIAYALTFANIVIWLNVFMSIHELIKR